jgi:DNA-binding NarL/FixJ family response regulator
MRKTQGTDSNQVAAETIANATGMGPPVGVYEALLQRQAAKKTTKKKNAAAVALGKMGGLKGGKARAASLSAEERKAIAQKAARKRWQKVAEAQKENTSEESQFLAYKKQGLTIQQIADRMGKSPAEISDLILRLINVMAEAQPKPA